MRCRAFLPASLIAALAITFAGRASADIIVNIDKDTQRMTVTVDGAELYVWPVSTGRPGNDTPNGTFRPNRMDPDHLSQEWDNAPMPHSIFFDLHGHAIHGFLNPNHIGNPASHGCVRLLPEKAALLYVLIAMRSMKETTVVISGRTPSLQSLVMARRHGLGEAAAALPVQFAPHSSEQPQPHRKDAAADGQYVKEAAAYQPEPAVYEKLQPPPAYRPAAAAYGQQPAAYGQQPATSGQQQQPTAYGRQPATGGQQQKPAAYGQRSAANAAYAQQDYRRARPYYGRPPYYGQPYYGQRSYYGQQLYYYLPPVYQQYYVVGPRNPY
jgi:hypothetical protein